MSNDGCKRLSVVAGECSLESWNQSSKISYKFLRGNCGIGVVKLSSVEPEYRTLSIPGLRLCNLLVSIIPTPLNIMALHGMNIFGDIMLRRLCFQYSSSPACTSGRLSSPSSFLYGRQRSGACFFSTSKPKASEYSKRSFTRDLPSGFRSPESLVRLFFRRLTTGRCRRAVRSRDHGSLDVWGETLSNQKPVMRAIEMEK